MSDNVTQIAVRKVKVTGNLVGSGNCTIGGMVRFNFTIIKGQKGLFASLPSHSYKDVKDGTTKYVNDVSIPDKNLYNEFQKAVVDAFENLGEKSSSNEGETAQTQTTGDGIPF